MCSGNLVILVMLMNKGFPTESPGGLRKVRKSLRYPRQRAGTRTIWTRLFPQPMRWGWVKEVGDLASN